MAARPHTTPERAQRGARRARRRRVRAARVATARTSPRRSSTDSPNAGFGSRTSTPPRCARRPAPACSPAATITPTAWPASPTSPSDSPATTGSSRRRTASSPRSSASTGTCRWRSASGTSPPRTRPTSPRRVIPGRCGRGFRHWYGFHGGETHQFVPNLFRDNTATLPPRGEAEGYHLSEDLADEAIAMLGELRSVEPEMPFFLHFATGACHSPHHAPDEWLEQYRGQFDDGWDALARRKPSPANRRWGSFPKAPPSRTDPTGCRRGTTSTPRTKRSRRGSWSASPRSSRTPTPRSVGSSTSSTSSASATTPSWSSCPTTAPRPKAVRSARSTTRASGTACPRGARSCAPASTRSAPRATHNNYPWGWTMAGNTPFRRWKREVHEGGVADPCIVHWPAGHRAPGTRSGPSSRTRSTSCPRCSS